MAAGSLLLFAVLAVGQGAKPAPPPLTEQQIGQIQELVRTTQATSDRLKALLEVKQRELAQRYAEFELDEKAVARLEAEILDAQRQLLANYHKMQVELRTIVGKERFLVLKQRLDRIVGPPGAAKEKR
jgi:hypothetical protein